MALFTLFTRTLASHLIEVKRSAVQTRTNTLGPWHFATHAISTHAVCFDTLLANMPALSYPSMEPSVVYVQVTETVTVPGVILTAGSVDVAGGSGGSKEKRHEMPDGTEMDMSMGMGTQPCTTSMSTPTATASSIATGASAGGDGMDGMEASVDISSHTHPCATPSSSSDIYFRRQAPSSIFTAAVPTPSISLNTPDHAQVAMAIGIPAAVLSAAVLLFCGCYLPRRWAWRKAKKGKDVEMVSVPVATPAARVDVNVGLPKRKAVPVAAAAPVIPEPARVAVNASARGGGSGRRAQAPACTFFLRQVFPKEQDVHWSRERGWVSR